MAVLESNQTVSNNRNGFDKEISKSARTMMLDNIQNFIYQKPIPSCVRETVSNAKDATVEKLVALQIIRGEIDVKDVYKTLDDVEVAKEGDNIYQDSEFKRDYYDENWLSASDRIDIKYTCNSVIGERDMFSISDNGVGIGDSRLEGIFSLGFSTKRLNANELGGFGIGQKSALATGVASYRMTTRHNGKQFCYDIFSHKVENVNGKWNENGEENPYIEFLNTMVESGKTKPVAKEDGSFIQEPILEPFKSYYTPTTEKNGTTIEFEVKSHNRQAFIDAVKSQLMYLKDDIVFTYTDNYGRPQNVDFKAKTVYEDDNIILSDYGFYNRPHFVIKGIAYGIIDFAEAELSPKFGNMGFKFSMENLDVLPSREGVRYTPKTTSAIVELYDKVKGTVETMVKESLSETKLFPWIKAAVKVTNRAGNGNSNDVLARLSSLVDQSEMDLRFNERIKYNSSFKSLFGPLFSLDSVAMEGYGRNQKPKREVHDNTSLIGDNTFFQFEKSSGRTTAYIMVSKHNFSTIRVNKNFNYLAPQFKAFVKNEISDAEFIEDCKLAINENELDDTRRKNVKEYLEKAKELLTLLKVDSLIPIYDDVQVPEDFTISAEQAENEVAEAIDTERYKQILKERRLNREFYIQKFVLRSNWGNDSALKREMVKYTELETLSESGCELVYFVEGDNPDLIRFLNDVPVKSDSNPLNNDKLLVFKVAKSNLSQVKTLAKPLEEWFYNIDENGKMMFAPLIKGGINKHLSYSPLVGSIKTNAKWINEGLHEKFNKLDKLTKNDSYVLTEIPIIKESIRIAKLAMENNNDYEAEVVSKAIFDFNTKNSLPSDVVAMDIINPKVIKISEELRDFERVYGKFLSNVNVVKVKEEVEIILQAKKDQLQFKFKGLHDDFNS